MKPEFGRRQGGFSLLEVLVSMTLLAVLLGVLMRISSQVLQNSGHAESYRMALMVAQSTMDRIEHEGETILREQSGRTEEDYRWQVEVEPYYELSDAAGMPYPHNVTVKVEWGEGDDSRHVSLASVRLLRGL